MRNLFRLVTTLFCLYAVQTTFTSCINLESPELTAAKKELTNLRRQQSLRNYPPSSYDYFVSHNQYPVTIKIYKDSELLKIAQKNCNVIICLQQQRGRLYVNGQVAADWPVSTGIPGRDTPTGNFSIREKRESYASNRYGKMLDKNGNCINGDADAFSDPVPEGGSFVGSPMPFWMRLTGDGVGMHIGKVRAGRRLSHGCIRMPGEMARELYRVASVGTRVSVVKDIEPQFPALGALSAGNQQNSIEKRIVELEKKIYDIKMKKYLAQQNNR